MKVIFTVFVAVCMVNSVACGNKKKTEPAQDQFLVKDNGIVIPENSPLIGRIKVETVMESAYRRMIQSPASVEANPIKMAQVTPPLTGRIVKLFVKLGDRVKVGDPLFSINAPDMVAAQKDYLEAKHQVVQAEIDWNRQTDLLAHGVGIKKEAEQAKTNLEIHKSALQQATTRLRLLGVNPDESAFGEPLIVRAPIRGKVITISITTGEFHNDPNETLLTIADLSTVWITANVKEKDIRFVTKGALVQAFVSAYPGKKFKGKVLFVDDILDAETRTVKVRVAFKNKNHKLKPGMFSTVIFSEIPQKAIIVSLKAIIQKDDKMFVFVQTSNDTYQKREVEVGETVNTSHVTIKSGLRAGDKIITEGTFYFTGI